MNQTLEEKEVSGFKVFRFKFIEMSKVFICSKADKLNLYYPGNITSSWSGELIDIYIGLNKPTTNVKSSKET